MTKKVEFEQRREALAFAQIMGERPEPAAVTIDRAREYYAYLTGQTPSGPENLG